MELSQTLSLLDLVQGPVFRCAFALMLLGLLRAGLLVISDAAAGYATARDATEFWWKVRMRVLWQLMPTLVLRRVLPGWGPGATAYHLAIGCASLLFRLGVIVVPVFMMAHVSLWERGTGTPWPALSRDIGDRLAVLTMTAGAIVFLGRIYSPALRRIEPTWAFLRPLVLLAPFVTGYLAAHPAWSPLDYQVVLLAHTLVAAVVFVLVPFAGLLKGLHTPLTAVVPAAAWSGEADERRRARQEAVPA